MSGIRLNQDIVMIPSLFYVLMVIKSMVSKEADTAFSDQVLSFLSSMKTFSGRGGSIQEKVKAPYVEPLSNNTYKNGG